MKSVPVGGVPIRFPQDLDPFPAQLALMSKVIASLKRSQNALLGSPTGTGKTLVRYVTLRQSESRSNANRAHTHTGTSRINISMAE